MELLLDVARAGVDDVIRTGRERRVARIFTASMPTTGPAPAASKHRNENCPMMPRPNTAALRPTVRPARTLTPMP